MDLDRYQFTFDPLWTSLFLWTHHGSDRRVELPETVHTFFSERP